MFLKELAAEQCAPGSPIRESFDKWERAREATRANHRELTRMTGEYNELQRWLAFAVMPEVTPEKYAVESARLALLKNGIDAAKTRHNDLEEDARVSEKQFGRILDEYRLVCSELRQNQYDTPRLNYLLGEVARLTGHQVTAA
jgi:hypothetical protein